MSKTVPVEEAQSHLRDLIYEKAEFVITEDGEPLARVVPIDKDRGPMYGTVKILGDIVEPIDEEWDALK